jgi:hypothetical protein
VRFQIPLSRFELNGLDLRSAFLAFCYVQAVQMICNRSVVSMTFSHVPQLEMNSRGDHARRLIARPIINLRSCLFSSCQPFCAMRYVPFPNSYFPNGGSGHTFSDMLKFLSCLLQKSPMLIHRTTLLLRDLLDIPKVRSGPRTRLQVNPCGTFEYAFVIRTSKRMMFGTCRYNVDAPARSSPDRFPRSEVFGS